MGGGSSLAAVFAAAAISVIIMNGISALLKTGFNGERHIELKDNLESIRQLILTSLDCDATFASAGIDPQSPGGNCGSNSAKGGQGGPFLRLRRLTLDGSVQWITGPLDSSGSGQIGEWNIRASCSSTEQSLVIRAARPASPQVFLADPLTRQPAAWEGPHSLLFGGGPGYGGSRVPIPICFAASQPATVASNLKLMTRNTVTSYAYPVQDYPLGTPYQYIPLVTPLPAVRAQRVGFALVRMAGYINWDGCTAAEDMLFLPTLEFSKNGGATFADINDGGIVVSNDGTNFVLERAFPVAPGDKIVVRPKIRFGMLGPPNACRLQTPCPITSTCVTNYEVDGVLVVSVN